MPDVMRLPMRMDCSGLDLTHPIDRMPPGSFPYLFNARVLAEGRIEGRPGYGPSLSLQDPPNSIRRLNDSTGLAPLGYIYVGGGGSRLYGGTEGSYNPIDMGYSGDPLSLIPFKPDQSPQSWMYVYDKNKSAKVRPDGVLQAVGVSPPGRAPVIDLGVPAWVNVAQGDTALGWQDVGTVVGSITNPARASTGTTIGVILYNNSNVGWCCLEPIGTSIMTDWMGDRMQVILNSGQPNQETVIVREIHQPITTTTIQGILYDSGNTGYCSIVLAGSPPNLARNSMLHVGTGGGAEGLRVLEVIPSPDGTSYSIRVFTVLTHVVNEPVVGVLSWYVYTVQTHAPTETITNPYIANTNPTGTGGVAILYPVSGTVSTSGTAVTNAGTTFVDWSPGTQIFINLVPYTIDYVVDNAHLVLTTSAGTQTSVAFVVSQISAAVANGRPISTSEDYLHISVYLSAPANVTKINLLIDIDANTGTVGNAFTNNYWEWTIPASELTALGKGSGAGWTEIVIPISSGTRFGGDFTRNFSNIMCVQFQIITTGSCDFGFDNWYFFGTYGPTILTNSPTGYIYFSRFRNSGTGAKSLPSPGTRYQLFPLREAVTVTSVASTQIGVDEIDIYRVGGNITGSPLYVGSVVNNAGSPNTYLDTLPDTFVLATNQPVDLTAIQPWPVIIPPLFGTCNVVGTTVIATSLPPPFDPRLLSNTAILINGQVFLTYGQPKSYTVLELTQDAGVLTGATFQIASPTLAAWPLPFVFGPLEGPFAPVLFGLGDENNPGTLYFTNSSDADTASDLNTMDLSNPSSGLVSGAVWNGLVFVGSNDIIYCVRYSYLTSIGASNNTTFQNFKVPTQSGYWARWAVCACPIGVAFLGRDGIYIHTDTQSVNITDEKLYLMFPHDGFPAYPVNSGSNIIYPVDMTQDTRLRLSYCDETLRFSYIDTAGNSQTLIYEIYKKRWFLNNYANQISSHYLIEWPDSGPHGAGDPTAILMLAQDSNSIYRSGGNTDNGADINTVVLTPSMDSGDERSQKLFVDTMTQADGMGVLNIAATYNNAQSFSPVVSVTVTGAGIAQYLQNISSLANLALYRNIGAKFAWTGGPQGPRLYAWEISGFLQPYLSSFFVTQFIDLSFPGWKHMRRMYPALISNSPVLMAVKTQDGRTYGPYTIPSTSGQFRILPQMLDHGIKDLAFAFQLDGQGQSFAFFPSEFTIECKQWSEETYIDLAVFKA